MNTSKLGRQDSSSVRRTIRFVALTLVVFIAVQSCVTCYLFNKSRNHLLENDPRSLQNRSELAFYFAPLRISRGKKLTVNELTGYLRDLAYVESDAPVPGSYVPESKNLTIRSRMPALFPDVSISFSATHVVGIKIGGRAVDTVLLEPLPLQNRVDFLDNPELGSNLKTRRIVIEPGTLPQLIVDAVTSAEDKRFFENQGVEWAAVTLRPIASLLSGRKPQGGSSISQQLIKNNVIKGSTNQFWQSGNELIDGKLGTFERKLVEIPMALEVNRMMSKDEILAAYLSANYMGSVLGVNLYGFAAASQEFFSRSVYQISDPKSSRDLAFAATLSGMIQAPESYLSFVKNGEKCADNKETCRNNLLARRNAILDLMSLNLPEKYDTNLISRAKREPLAIKFASESLTNRPIQAESLNFASYAATSRLPRELRDIKDEVGQIKVFTTLDLHLQQAAVDAMSAAKKRVQLLVNRAYTSQRAEDGERFSKIERACQEKGTHPKDDCEHLFNVEASLIAVDAQTGGILAMTTGVAPNSQRSPGSVVKPFYYLKALETGTFKGEPFAADSIVDPDKDLALLQEYCTSDLNLGRSGTVREQLANSWNIGACLAAQSAGIPTDFVGSITGSKPERTLMSAIGGTRGSEVTLPNLVQAYTIFPNNGKQVKLTAYERAYHGDLERFERISLSEQQPQTVADPGATFITTQLMRSVVTAGTASSFQSTSGIPSELIGGKSGSGMIADLWWVNFTPRIVVGVWVGMPNNLPELRREDGFTGSRISAPIAAEFMRAVARIRPDLVTGSFEPPPSVVRCESASTKSPEYFIRDRAPKSCAP